MGTQHRRRSLPPGPPAGRFSRPEANMAATVDSAPSGVSRAGIGRDLLPRGAPTAARSMAIGSGWSTPQNGMTPVGSILRLRRPPPRLRARSMTLVVESSPARGPTRLGRSASGRIGTYGIPDSIGESRTCDLSVAPLRSRLVDDHGDRSPSPEAIEDALLGLVVEHPRSSSIEAELRACR